MKRIVAFCVVWALGTLVVGGCAKENVVKKDEAIAPSATTKKQADIKAEKSAAIVPVKSVSENAGKEVTKAEPRAKEQLATELEKVYFDFDSYTLSGEARKALTNNADYLRRNTAAKLRIEGNCDERGSAEYNIALGEKRAKTAMKYLVTMGIPADRLATISYGKEKPADPGHDEAAWAKNRRDDFTVLSK
ncbi:peptidoglycan-associated lipoprotein Pal [Oryzomonas sagensis]|uniref:Peptidoglycan-associated lipoprotein n=1 Tax=Oryzomonas sagensis TaxID=2603857 RepID=A0ABQ6TLM1_9BACT|nr:peptidoglycan-associated lipoprotein Pal [Oryzomonas sagensis]KAB0669101.1 peptidoglycan-associated lipoprotein Pal [Oryzomonas sagensis]